MATAISGAISLQRVARRGFSPAFTLVAATLALLIASASGAQAAAKSASLVIDANTGKVLHEKNADARRYPASLTKMMTLYMVFDAIKRGKLTYKTKIRATKAATLKPPSKIGLRVGDRLTIRQVVAALVTKSANDVAAAIAIHIGGSEARFAKMMTRKARQIGMRNTRFRNASGLTDRLQRTTARDMITLALRLQDDFPRDFGQFRIRTFKWRGKRFGNHNSLLRSFYGTTGIKTGYTRASGFNLVSSVKRGRRYVVAAVFGGKTARARNAKMRILLSRALKRASKRKTRRSSPLLVARPRQVTQPASLSLAALRSPPPATRRARTAQRPPKLPARAPATASAQRQIARPPQVVMSRTRRVVFRETFAPRPTAETVQGVRAGMPTSIGDLLEQRQPRRATPAAAPRSARTRPSPTDQQALDRLARGLPLANIASSVPRPRLAARPSLRPAVYRPAQPSRQRRSAPTAPALRQQSGPAIQVGAYASQRLASQQLMRVRGQHPSLLTGASGVPERAVVNGRTIYRARFVGLGWRAAQTACRTMNAAGVACLLVQ
ncbi:MAG: serine hydrolase [Pseudomonadota bacterium]